MGDTPQLTDSALMRHIAEGSKEAYAVLVRRYALRCGQLAYGQLGDITLAEDVVQDVFTKLWVKAFMFDENRAQFTTWLYRIVVNRCLDEKRKKKPEPLPENYEERDDRPLVEENLVHEGQRQIVIAAVNGLPERQSIAITLSYFDDVSNLEAAGIMGVNIKAYESLLVRARAKLKQMLTEQKEFLLEKN